MKRKLGAHEMNNLVRALVLSVLVGSSSLRADDPLNPPIEEPTCAAYVCGTCIAHDSPDTDSGGGAHFTDPYMGLSSLDFRLSMGRPLYPGALCPGRLCIRAEAPTMDLSTPKCLYASALPRILSDEEIEMAGGEKVRTVHYADRDGMVTIFKNGIPTGKNVARPLRLVCPPGGGYEIVTGRFGESTAGPHTDVFLESVSPTHPVSYLSKVRFEATERTLADDGIEIILNPGDGSIRQFRAPEGLADVVTDVSGALFEIRFFASSQIGVKGADGLYQPSGLPLRTFTFADGGIPPEGGSPSGTPLAHLIIRDTWDTQVRETFYDYESNGGGWSLLQKSDSGNKLSKVYTDDNGVGSTYNKFWEVGIAQDIRKTKEVRQRFGWGVETVQRVEDFDGLARTTATTWYSDDPSQKSYGRVKSVQRPDGSWVQYTYDAEGRVATEMRSWLDEPPTTEPSKCQVISYGYVANTEHDTVGEMDRRPRQVIVANCGVEVKRTYHSYEKLDGVLVATKVECTVPAAAYNAESNLRTVTTYTSASGEPSWQAGQIASKAYPDGRKETYAYDRGTLDAAGVFSADALGDAHRTIVTHASALAPDDRTRQQQKVTITDERGLQRVEETRLWNAGEFVQVASTLHDYDLFGRRVASHHNDNTTETYSYDGPRRVSETSRAGIVEQYAYDDLDREIARTRKGMGEGFYPAQVDLKTSRTLDVMGNVLTETLTGGALSLVTTYQYDGLGRRTAKVDPAGITTLYTYAADGRSSTVDWPGDAVEITERYVDGRVKSVTGVGVVARAYEYGVNADGTQWMEVFTGPGSDGQKSPMWEKTTTDLLGRTVRVERPGPGGVGVAATEYFYNARGQLEKTTSPGQAPTLIVYDAWGEAGMSGLDMDSNNYLDPSLMDRVVSNDWGYVLVGTEWWKESRSIAFPFDNNDQAVITRVTRVAVGGPGCACDGAKTESVDIHGNVTKLQRYYQAGFKREIQEVLYPDSATPEEVVSVNGLVQYQKSRTGVQVDFKYDDLGRQIEQSSTSDGGARCVKTVTHYNDKGQVDWTSDAAGNKTWFTYDAVTGRRTEVKDALNQVTVTQYDARGSVTHVSGATYPVSYGYDDWGRMTSMKTYRQEGEAGDTTTWTYDLATGLLVGKTYADGKGPTYAYYPDGKLMTRTWARTAGGNPLTTTYSYNLAGELLGIDYSDPTPDVVYTRDRLGRPVTIADGSGTRTISYDEDTLALLAETQPAGGVTLTRTYDAKGRSAGFFLGAEANPDYEVAYGYDAGNGRFASVTNGRGANAKVFQYGYLPGSDLIETVTHPNGVVATKAYETQRDLVDYVENKHGETVISKYDYVNDVLGRRTDRTDSGTVFGANPVPNDFDYDVRSQVMGATMGADQYGYAYDPIGNRTSYTKNQAATTYTANQLNQYTAISGQPDPTYDDDGNMLALRSLGEGGLNQGDWTCQWDAENRLIEAVQTPVQTDSKKLTFSYDYMSRRYSKKVYVYTAASQYELQSSIAFVYDGWNMIRELDAMNGNAAIRSHVWGLDLSQTLQGAGGVGGLLGTLTSDSSLLTACYDANGNIGEYVASDGTVAAHYEYDPFGNTTASSGASAGELPHRFSSKYLDGETGLYYYGYRYFSPQLGRWLVKDRVGIRGGPNSLAFAGNCPLSSWDLLGLAGMAIEPPGRPDPWEVLMQLIWDITHGPPRIEEERTLLSTSNENGEPRNPNDTSQQGRSCSEATSGDEDFEYLCSTWGGAPGAIPEFSDMSRNWIDSRTLQLMHIEERAEIKTCQRESCTCRCTVDSLSISREGSAGWKWDCVPEGTVTYRRTTVYRVTTTVRTNGVYERKINVPEWLPWSPVPPI